MRKIACLITIFIFFGCTQKVSEEDLDYLNGYWEIAEVTFPNGKTKEFRVNPTIDYIELKELKGFRKKVQPKFDGNYSTSNDAEVFVIIRTGEAFEFYYKNDMSEWKEKIKSVSKDRFSVVNQDSLTYSYKRFQPINAKQ